MEKHPVLTDLISGDIHILNIGNTDQRYSIGRESHCYVQVLPDFPKRNYQKNQIALGRRVPKDVAEITVENTGRVRFILKKGDCYILYNDEQGKSQEKDLSEWEEIIPPNDCIIGFGSSAKHKKGYEFRLKTPVNITKMKREHLDKEESFRTGDTQIIKPEDIKN
ncbi:hypothetical protein GOV12_01945 [Candidatus Pacearchaeota archaeon]|nr:hypothetical protein [Candidatus Pacearchaeota archaeon]